MSEVLEGVCSSLQTCSMSLLRLHMRLPLSLLHVGVCWHVHVDRRMQGGLHRHFAVFLFVSETSVSLRRGPVSSATHSGLRCINFTPLNTQHFNSHCATNSTAGERLVPVISSDGPGLMASVCAAPSAPAQGAWGAGALGSLGALGAARNSMTSCAAPSVLSCAHQSYAHLSWPS